MFGQLNHFMLRTVPHYYKYTIFPPHIIKSPDTATAENNGRAHLIFPAKKWITVKEWIIEGCNSKTNRFIFKRNCAARLQNKLYRKTQQ